MCRAPLLLQFLGLLALSSQVTADVSLGTCASWEAEDIINPNVTISSLSFSPYPVVLHLPKTYDITFAIEVKEEIPEDASIVVFVSRVGFYGNLPLLCIESIQDIIDGLTNITKPDNPTTTTTADTTTTTTSDTTTTTTFTFPTLPDVDPDCHFDISEVFGWSNGSLCEVIDGGCSEILKVGTHTGTVNMPVPYWLGLLNAAGALDQYIAGTYVLDIGILGSINEPLGCSSVEFEISTPKPTTTTTQEPDPENNVILDSCSKSAESSVEVSSLLISPYPILLHSFRSYDVSFAINVTEAIPDDARISVAVERGDGDKFVPLPCLTEDDIPNLLPPFGGDLTMNETCEFNFTQVQEWNNGALCDLFANGCQELHENGTHAAKVTMKVPAFLGSAIFAGNLDGFIAGIYKLDISLLDSEDEVLGCASVTFELETPTTTTETTNTETTSEDGGNGGFKPIISIFAMFVCLFSVLVY